MNTKHKIVDLDHLAGIVVDLKKQNKKIVTTNGAFDILHVGHKRALEESKSLGDILIVGVNSDVSVRQYKSDVRPIISEDDRAEMVAGFECVDYVVIFNQPDPINFLNQIKPHVHTKAGDYKAEELIEYPTLIKNGGEIMTTPLVEGKSTTGIIERILESYTSKYSEKK